MLPAPLRKLWRVTPIGMLIAKPRACEGYEPGAVGRDIEEGFVRQRLARRHEALSRAPKLDEILRADQSHRSVAKAVAAAHK